MVCAPEQHGGKVPVPEITSHIRLLIRDRGQMHFVVGRIRGLERSRLPQAMRNRPRRRVFRSSLAELQIEKDSMAERVELIESRPDISYQLLNRPRPSSCSE